MSNYLTLLSREAVSFQHILVKYKRYNFAFYKPDFYKLCPMQIEFQSQTYRNEETIFLTESLMNNNHHYFSTRGFFLCAICLRWV